MSDVLTKHNSLMEKIVREHGSMIRNAVYKVSDALPSPEDVVSEVHFAIFMTLRKLGSGWAPPRSFISTLVKNKISEVLRQKTWEADDAELIRKRQTEQVIQREEVMAQVHTLTPSEFKVFRLLGLGLTNQEIAESLFISPLTVRTHVKRIHAKCDIKGRAKLALTAYQACYSEQPDAADEYLGLQGYYLEKSLRPEMLSQRVS
jgi:RNA polymerase sigma factor (sigma-70 family)